MTDNMTRSGTTTSDPAAPAIHRHEILREELRSAIRGNWELGDGFVLLIPMQAGLIQSLMELIILRADLYRLSSIIVSVELYGSQTLNVWITGSRGLQEFLNGELR